MPAFSFALISSTLTELLNTPLVPPEQRRETHEVPLTDMPLSAERRRSVRESRRAVRANANINYDELGADWIGQSDDSTSSTNSVSSTSSDFPSLGLSRVSQGLLSRMDSKDPN